MHPNLNGFSQFGFGRRTCQGVPIVDQDLFLAMGGMAWAFHITKKRRPDGTEIPVHWNEYTPLLIAKPAPFEFDAVPRSKAIANKLNGMWDSGKGEDDEEEEEERVRIAEAEKTRRRMPEKAAEEKERDEDNVSVGGSETSGPSDSDSSVISPLGSTTHLHQRRKGLASGGPSSRASEELDIWAA